MASQNAVIAKIEADFAAFVLDFKAYVANAQSGANGTVLSPTDAADLTALDSQLTAMDATIHVPAPTTTAPPTT